MKMWKSKKAGRGVDPGPLFSACAKSLLFGLLYPPRAEVLKFVDGIDIIIGAVLGYDRFVWCDSYGEVVGIFVIILSILSAADFVAFCLYITFTFYTCAVLLAVPNGVVRGPIEEIMTSGISVIIIHFLV